jgi:glyoxylase-like metal-dependent hydrolase (beta-lactamase superfamily II)
MRSRIAGGHRSHRNTRSGLGPLTLCAGLIALGLVSAASAARLEFYHLAPGFVAETFDTSGFPSGTGFAAINPWGQYTAYLMLTDPQGRRTWRIEHNLPRLSAGTAQGSTMYLLEGSQRALLIDTANPASATEGVNDLKTLVRWLLAHDNSGGLKGEALDFVVANTHNHPDHIGENARMSDRTVYYMDGDWPASNAPSNYLPIKEGGGATPHGPGTAVGEIDLGGRKLQAIDVPPHTDGSIAYLDADNQLLFTGDALGSSWPFLQRGPITQFIQTLRHVLKLTAPYRDLVVLPAHYYQTGAYDKVSLPRDQQILNRRYIADLLDAATGVVNGEICGSPFFTTSRDYFAVSGTGRFVFTLDNVGRQGEALPSNYHVASIPGNASLMVSRRSIGQSINKVIDQAVKTYLIRGPTGESLFLVDGSKRALLIGTGSGAPGLRTVVARLSGGLPLDVALLDDDSTQTRGLAQLSPATIFTATDMIFADSRLKALKNGDVIDLGTDTAGKPLQLEAQSLAAPDKPSLTLVSRGDQVLYVGTALGAMSTSAPLPVSDPPALRAALTDWLFRVGGKFRNVYSALSPAWYTDPSYLEQLQQTLTWAATGRGAAQLADDGHSATVRITADVPAVAGASILVARNSIRMQ